MRQLKFAETIFEFAISAFLFISGVLLTLIILAVCTDVVMRYLFNRPIFWVAELSEYSLLYITFLGTAWLLKQGGHVKIDLFTSRLAPKKRERLAIVSGIIGIFISVVFTYYGFKVTWDLFERGVFNPTLLEFPKGPLIAVIPIGFFLLLIQFVRMIYASWKTLKGGNQ
jgi:TRAP-type C4-dicarboxylate transport system permease small subunit